MSKTQYQFLFFALVGGYCLCYAPFGLNETDGGFLSGLAWQVLNGKVLYQDIVYVRPPLPVWLRALELQCLPEHFAVLGERWIFYTKVALYSWLGAAVLAPRSVGGERRWQLAVLGFVVSAHSYPPMAWHTVDGILFAVVAAYFAVNRSSLPWRGAGGEVAWAGIAGGFFFGALLCKQSFYPLLPLFAVFLFFGKENRWRKMAWFFGAFALCSALFFHYLNQKNILSNFLQMTGGAASGGQAFQHGVLDYFRITPALALPSLVLLAPVVWWFWKGKNAKLALGAWLLWLFALVASYAAITWWHQEHTAPIAQSRMMFWVGAGFYLCSSVPRSSFLVHSSSFLLLGISWCAAISWGYNFPVLFATPWVWAGMEVTRLLQGKVSDGATQSHPVTKYTGFAMLVALLLAFHIGHEFVYRDGRRSEMREPMGAIFPQLSGIYADRETAELYRDLKQLAERYGPNFKTLPAFPQANFLTQTPPPLPLDWVVNRETNGNNDLVFKNLGEKKPVVFIQKSFREKIGQDPELEVTRRVFQQGKILEETPHFFVITMNYEL